MQSSQCFLPWLQLSQAREGQVAQTPMPKGAIKLVCLRKTDWGWRAPQTWLLNMPPPPQLAECSHLEPGKRQVFHQCYFSKCLNMQRWDCPQHVLSSWLIQLVQNAGYLLKGRGNEPGKGGWNQIVKVIESQGESLDFIWQVIILTERCHRTAAGSKNRVPERVWEKTGLWGRKWCHHACTWWLRLGSPW